jgi:hypothetical protein
VEQSRPRAHSLVASTPVGSQGREQMWSGALVESQETLVLQKEPEPTPQSESLLQNCRQVLTGCVAVEQVLYSKHAEPGMQSVISVQNWPGVLWPAE